MAIRAPDGANNTNTQIKVQMQIQIHKCLTHLESTYHHLIDGTRDQDQQHRVGEVSGRNGHETINMIYEKEVISAREFFHCNHFKILLITLESVLL